MNLLLTTDTVGGVWTYAIELARALAPHDVRVALATMGTPLSTDQRRQVDVLPNVELHESLYKLEWMRQPWDDVRDAGRWLLDLESRFRPDVVHLNGYAHGALPWRAPVLVAAHSCVCSWWQAVKGEAAPPEWDRYRREARAGLRAADLVVAPSASMLAAVQHHYGPLTSARVIPNGRDGSLYRPRWKEEFVLSAGRLWDEAKNVAALGRVAADLPWPVYVAGDDKSPDGHGAAGPRRARTLGRLDQSAMAHWLGRAAIYALPARYEPFGLSALEAAMSGCALVLGDIPSLREVWGDAAVFVPPHDDDALRAVLQSLIDDPEARAHRAHRAAVHAQRYSPSRMAALYLQAYRELIARPAEPNVLTPIEAPAARALA